MFLINDSMRDVCNSVLQYTNLLTYLNSVHHVEL